MSILRTLKKLLFGETWILPMGIASILAASYLIRPLATKSWPQVGGPILLAAIILVLLASVAHTARRR